MSGKPGANRKPRVFVGSSQEGKPLAELLQLGLEDEAETTLGCQGVFALSKGTLEDLVRIPRAYDFAVLVLSPDDQSLKRGVRSSAPRDNVIFELGLFMGSLGRERTFVVCPRDEALELPTDFAGITLATYASREDGNLQAALGPACTQVKAEIRRVSGLPAVPEGKAAGKSGPRKKIARRRRRRSLGVAHSAGPAKELRIVDISATGALLETEGEIPVGQLLNLELNLENGATACVTARVARVQYPAWGAIGGVGVAFTEFDGRSEEIIRDYTATEADAFDEPKPSEGEGEGSVGE